MIKMESEAIMICIYADTSSGGFRGPVFPDLTFEGIPIPNDSAIGIKYDEIIGVHGKPLSAYIPSKASFDGSTVAHFDPDPVHLTYGDCGESIVTKRCKKLKPGDLLLWSARLEPFVRNSYTGGDPRVYLIGWLMVERVIDYEKLSKSEEREIFNQRHLNHHLLLACRKYEQGKSVPCYNWEEFLENLKNGNHVVVIGNKHFGGQLQQAIPLTEPLDGNYPIMEDKQALFKSAEYILRNNPYILDYDQAWKLIRNKPIKNPIIPLQWH